MADLELKKAFTEMQINKIESSKKLRYLEIQGDTLKKSKARYEITDVEVGGLDPGTRVYSAVGRMFVLSNVPEMRTELQQKTKKVNEMLEQCEKNKGFLIQNLKDQEDHLRELVQQKKDMK